MDQFRAGLQCHAALSLGIFQVFDGGEGAIGEDRVGERPEVFSGLELGRVGGQEQEVDVLGDLYLDAAMPASPVEGEDDFVAGPRTTSWANSANSISKSAMLTVVARCNTVRQSGGMDKAHEVAPGVAVLDRHHGALVRRVPNSPHPPHNRFEANALLRCS